MPSPVAAFVSMINTVIYRSPNSVNAIDRFECAGPRSIDDISKALNRQPTQGRAIASR